MLVALEVDLWILLPSGSYLNVSLSAEKNVVFVTSVSRDSLRDPIKTLIYQVSIIRGKGLRGSSCGGVKEIFASTFLIQGTVLT